jgi:hypothetical protein
MGMFPRIIVIGGVTRAARLLVEQVDQRRSEAAGLSRILE